jgi:integrase
MARTKPKERARKRVLTDDEIRYLWQALDVAKAPAPFAPFVRVLLLTAQRRDEVSHMQWSEIDGDCWVLPAPRSKTGVAISTPLTPAVRELLGSPGGSGFIFTTTAGAKPFSGYSKAKKALDKAISDLRERDGREPLPRWTLHDLRRTARSLMSRCGGVPADIAERVLGHAIPGVRGVYDLFEYLPEKTDALTRLGALVEQILNPAADNVVAFGARR